MYTHPLFCAESHPPLVEIVCVFNSAFGSKALDNVMDWFTCFPYSIHPLLHYPSGVWHPGGGQREVFYRRLLCEPDLTGASVPQLCSVPALHGGQAEIRRGVGSPSIHPSDVHLPPCVWDGLCTWTCRSDTLGVGCYVRNPSTYIYIHTHAHRDTQKPTPLCSAEAEVQSSGCSVAVFPQLPSNLRWGSDHRTHWASALTWASTTSCLTSSWCVFVGPFLFVRRSSGLKGLNLDWVEMGFRGLMYQVTNPKCCTFKKEKKKKRVRRPPHAPLDMKRSTSYFALSFVCLIACVCAIQGLSVCTLMLCVQLIVFFFSFVIYNFC